MKSKLKHNLGLKLLAVLFAVVLWMISADINDPVDSKYISGVKVKIINEDLLTAKNQTYKVLNASDTVRVQVRAKESILEEITEEDVTVRADLANLSENNTVKLDLIVDSSIENRVEYVQMNSEYLYLQIDELAQKQFRIEVITSGELPDGYVLGKITTETNTMSISGPETAVGEVTRAIVDINLDNATSNIAMAASIRLLNSDGKDVSDNDLKKSINSVMINVPVLPTKEVPVRFQYSGVPGEGFAATGNVTASSSSVVVAGKESLLDNLTEIVVPASELSLDGVTENLVKNLDIRKYLPAEVILAGNSNAGTIQVDVEVLPLRQRVIAFRETDIQLFNKPDPQQWVIEPVSGQSLRLELEGLEQDLEGIDLSVVVPHIDLKVLLNEEGALTEGEFDTEILFLIPETVTKNQNATVKLRVRQVIAEAEEE